MNAYAWPMDSGGGERDDDAGGRQRFVAPRRVDFDREGALAAGRMVAPTDLEAPARPRRTKSQGVTATPPPQGDPQRRSFLWQPLGPITVIDGQAIGTPRITGRVHAIAVHSDGERIYAASANGGVWYSKNGGNSWASIGDFAPAERPIIDRPAQHFACGAIHVIFGATEADDDVFVGTGEPAGTRDTQPGRHLGGVGILVAHGPAVSTAANPWTREANNLVGQGVYRFAQQPGTSTLVAATSIGLLQRPTVVGDGVAWERVQTPPFKDIQTPCTDVLWTKGDGTRVERLWVWSPDSAEPGLWVHSKDGAKFERVPLANGRAQRAALAANDPPDQIFVLNDRHYSNAAKSLPTALFRVDAPNAAAPTSAIVANVADVLGGQGWRNNAITVHPGTPNRVVICGNYADTSLVPAPTALDGTDLSGDASIVVLDVTTTGATLSATNQALLGVGVHSDVSDIKYSNNGTRLWAATDGGVFRADNPASVVSFYPVSDGMSIIESNYIANHPVGDGFVIAGLQDNGIIARMSTRVWANVGLGDGGGVGFDPLKPERFFRQYHNGSWDSQDGVFSFSSMTGETAAFYSTPAVIGHRRAGDGGGIADVRQVLLGTDRVWYSDDFGANWVTLPKATMPAANDTTQDAFGEFVTVCRWQNPDIAWILGEGRLMRYSRTSGSDKAGGPGSWTRKNIIKKGVKNKKDSTSADGPIRDSEVWTDIAVNLDPPLAPGQPGVQRGTDGALYLGTIGKVGDVNVDTLWWFNGTSKWFKTGLRSDPNGVPAPVTAIVCDPDHPDEVYVGTTVGVWRGIRTQLGNADPSWTWSSKVNGLPEAAVEDLQIFTAGTLRLLRAGLASRGVWEVRLDTQELIDLTYIRAHDDDLRHREAVNTRRNGKSPRSWHGSPDVRPRLAALAVAAPSSLPWTRKSFSSDDLRRFQSALRSRTGDKRVRATGKWDNYFNEVLRDLGAPILPVTATVPANTVGINKVFWDLSMKAPGGHGTREPWGAGVPSEVDLYELTAKLREGAPDSSSCWLTKGATKVEVVVHHRGPDPVDGANVRVALLVWKDSKKKLPASPDDASTWFSGDVPFKAAVNELLNAGSTAKKPGTDWAFATPNPVTLTGQTIDVTQPGIASFDLPMTGIKTGAIVLVAAVIHVTGDPDPLPGAAEKLDHLAFNNPNVAVRSLEIL